MKRIKTLSLMVANQIAAGEVIERPASVVKELFENAIDSGASQITVDIGFGGLNKIIVSDNGCGIYEDDLLLAIAPHATSKINALGDLDTLESMGFRGEALASIASVAKLQIISKTTDASHATKLECFDGEYRLLPAAREQGTTIEALDLFYNAPVRKKFLKSERTEFLAIESLVRRLAMSAPHVQVTLIHNAKQQLNLPYAKTPDALLKRARQMLGKKFSDAALPIEAQCGNMFLRGWICSSQYQRSQHDGYWVYLNQRFIKDKLLNHAIKQAYAAWLSPGRYPVCLLYLTIEPHLVDVNVHPTKHEVRFQNARLVHDFLVSEIQQALMLWEQGGEMTIEQQQPDCISRPQALLSSIDSSTDLPLAHVVGSTPRTVSRFVLPSSSGTALPESPASTDQHVMQQFMVDQQFGLLLFKANIYLVDWECVRYHWHFDYLMNKPMPWPSRSLFVPISITHDQIDDQQGDHLMTLLKPFGLDLSRHQDGLVLETLPIYCSQLKIAAFFDAIFALKELTRTSFIHILSKQGAEHPEWMSEADRHDFDAYWQRHWEILCSKPQLAKILSAEMCRAVLHG